MEDRLDDMIIEMAHHLGETIKQDRRFERYEKAQEAFREDGSLSHMITEYNAQQTALSRVYATKDIDQELITAMEGRINTLYFEITENEVFKEFNAAKEEIDNLIKDVNDEIIFVLTGERPHSCSGDCSSCGSACGHNHSHESEEIAD